MSLSILVDLGEENLKMEMYSANNFGIRKRELITIDEIYGRSTMPPGKFPVLTLSYWLPARLLLCSEGHG
ncbi:hypothetical protein SLA2020_321310 [Shorea laevis]